MTAAHPFASPDRQAEQRAHEPSMEEILASIRRIIADDQAFTSRVSGAPAPAVALPETASEAPEPEPTYDEPPASEPTLQAGAHAVEPTAPSQPAQILAQPEPTFSEVEPLRGSVDPVAQAEPAKAPEPPAPPAVDEVPLVSPRTDAAVSSAFSALVATQFMRETAVMPDLIRDMVRPMLKTWLDDNLPSIVERLVRVEIERVARGGR